MKTFLSLLLLTATLFFIACGNNNSAYQESSVEKKDTTGQTPNNDNNVSPKTATVNKVVSGYLQLKNALANDNGKEASDAAGEMTASLERLDTTSLSPEEKKMYDDVKDDVKEHAEHISANGSNIAHQREHFDLLSQDMIDLVKTMGSAKTLYKDYCPMYNNNKGASWLSETKEIKNPYLGKKMPTCGAIKEEIKAKG